MKRVPTVPFDNNVFDETLVKAQRLNRHNEGSRSVRGVTELSEASKQLSRGYISEQNRQGVLRLMSQKNFDAQKLSEQIGNARIEVSCTEQQRMRCVVRACLPVCLSVEMSLRPRAHIAASIDRRLARQAA